MMMIMKGFTHRIIALFLNCEKLSHIQCKTCCTACLPPGSALNHFLTTSRSVSGRREQRLMGTAVVPTSLHLSLSVAFFFLNSCCQFWVFVSGLNFTQTLRGDENAAPGLVTLRAVFKCSEWKTWTFQLREVDDAVDSLRLFRQDLMVCDWNTATLSVEEKRGQFAQMLQARNWGEGQEKCGI